MILLPALALAASMQSPAPAPARSGAAYTAFLEALSLREAGRLDEALAALQRVLRSDPKAADALAEIAKIQALQNRFDLAVATIGRAIEMAPGRADLRSVAGRVHQLAAQNGGGEKELRLAVADLEKAAELSPGEPAPLRDLTRLYSVLRDTKGALGAWRRLAEADPRNVDALIEVATLSVDAGDTDGAVKALEGAIALDPEDSRSLQMLGEIQQKAGRVEEALAKYQAAAKLDPSDLVTRLKIGEILLERKDARAALAQADEIVKVDEENRFGRDLKVRALKELGRTDEALALAETLAASDPRDLKTAFLVITLLEQKGSFEVAEQRLEALLRRSPQGEDAESLGRNNRIFWAHMGLVRQRLGRFKDAADAFGEAVKAAKEKDATLVSYRIDALVSAKDFATALKEARAARADPAYGKERDFKVLEAYALQGTGDAAGGAAVIEAGLDANDAPVEDLMAAADYHQRAKNFDKARAYFERAAARDTSNVRARFSLGAVLERLKRFDEAEKAFREALALSPDAAIVQNYLGYMNADRNVKLDEALALIRKAVESEPDNGSYLDSLAWAYYRLGQHAQAEEAIRKAVTTQDKNAVVIAHMGFILAARGASEEALRYLKMALTAEDEDGELDRAQVENKIRSLSSSPAKNP